VVTPMLQRGEKLALPRARTREPADNADALTISLPPDHSVWLGTQRIAAAELPERLRREVQARPGRKLVIRGDASLRVRDVSAVVQAAHSAGAAAFSLAVEEVKP